MKRRRRRADSHGRQCCINLSSPSTYSGRPLMLDFLLLAMVFVTATIVTVHGGLDETSSGGEQQQQHKSGLNDDHDERIAHELKLFNQQHSRSRSSGSGSKTVFTGPYSSSSPSSSSSFTNGNVSVYSIRRNQQSSSSSARKTTNSNRRGANSNHTAAQSPGGNKRKKLEAATSLRPKSSVVRLSEIDRDSSGYFDNNNRSEARGEWSGKS